jgi:hypothetical protein
MTTSRIIAIADAVVDALSSASASGLSMPFVAQRKYVPQSDLVDGPGLYLNVVPMTSDTHIVSRQDSQEEYEIHIGVQKKVVSATPEVVDPLMNFVQEVLDFWHRKGLLVTAGTGNDSMSLKVYCTSVSNNPVYSTDHLKQLVMFVSLVKLTFLVIV